METYSDLLKHPKWQKKRLEIMQRDNFECQLCHDKETSLNVHHKKYINGKKPWEYKNDDLVTLCKHCHEVIELTKKSWTKGLFNFEKVKILSLFNEETKISFYRYDDHDILVAFYRNGIFSENVLIHKKDTFSIIDYLNK
jgi:hypothetical protein